MDLTRFHPVFLFTVCLLVVAAHVEPPTNVNLRCRNLHNTLEWEYSQIQPGLQFKVDIHAQFSSPKVLLVDPPNLQADISFLSDPSNSYFVTVTAVIGQNESDAAPPDGIEFSYFMSSPAKHKCFVDFPPINATAQQDGSVRFHFMHPWLLYHHKLRSSSNSKPWKMKRHEAQARQLLPELKYDVIINQTKPPEQFICEESVCKGRLAVDLTQEKQCLKVKGEMQKMLIQATQEYCAQPLQKIPHEQNSKLLVYTIVPVLLISMVACVSFMVYKKQTKPSSSSSLPNSMTFPSRLRQWTFGVVQEQVSVPDVEPTSPTPLLTTTEEVFTVTTPTEPDPHVPTAPTVDEGVCDVMEERNDEGSGYTHGRNVEEDETEFLSGVSTDYEKRPVFVQLAPDEETEGYRS